MKFLKKARDIEYRRRRRQRSMHAATVAAKLISSAAGVALSLPTISAVDADSMMGEGELHGLRLPGDSVRAPRDLWRAHRSRLQEGV